MLFAGKVLRELKLEFFRRKKDGSARGMPDVRTIYEQSEYHQSNLMRGYRICFSGVLEKNQPKEENFFYRKAQKFGANILEGFKDPASPQPHYLIVQSVKRITDKIKIARERNIPIIHCYWIDACYRAGCRLPADCFTVKRNQVPELSALQKEAEAQHTKFPPYKAF